MKGGDAARISSLTPPEKGTASKVRFGDGYCLVIKIIKTTLPGITLDTANTPPFESPLPPMFVPTYLKKLTFPSPPLLGGCPEGLTVYAFRFFF